jgi:hypothetical protein
VLYRANFFSPFPKEFGRVLLLPFASTPTNVNRWLPLAAHTCSVIMLRLISVRWACYDPSHETRLSTKGKLASDLSSILQTSFKLPSIIPRVLKSDWGDGGIVVV